MLLTGVRNILRSPITLVLVFALLWLLVSRNMAPCMKPLEYKVGQFDTRLGVTQEEFTQTLKEAEQMWEQALDRDVFNYNEKAEFPVNVMYTDLQKKYDDLQAYNTEVISYNSKLAQYNEKVDYWNSMGGAPTNIFNELQKEKARLETQSKDLARRHITADQLITGKEAVGTFEDSGINIYMFTTLDHLRITLAHELGHAFIKDHSTDPESIMYYQEVDIGPKELKITPADVEAVRAACGWE